MNRVHAVLAVLVLLVLGGLAWWLLGSTGPGPGGAGDGTGPAAAGTGADGMAKSPPAAKAAPKGWALRGRGSVVGVLRECVTERPLGGVSVFLRAGTPGPGATLEAKTAEDGSFRFPEAANFDAWTLVASPPAPLAEVEVAPVEVIEDRVTDLGVLHAAHGFAVPGIVLDEAGRPVEGALVRAVRAKAKQAGMDFLRLIRELPRPHASVDEAKTGPDGRFALKRLVPGTYEMEASAKGFRLTAERGVIVSPASSSREIRIVLGRGYALRGRVVRRTEGPIEGLRVVALLQPRGDREILEIFEKVATVTDERGEFVVEGLGAGTHVVGVEAPHEPHHLAVNVEVPRDDYLEIVIEGDCWLEGRVVDAAGEPVAAAQVYVTNFQGNSPLVAHAETGADGRYRITSLRSGPVQLFLVQAEGFGTYPEDFMAVLRGGQSELILKPGPNEKNVSLGKGGIVRGRVVAQGTSDPVPGARVSLVSLAALFGGSRTGTSDAEGRFEIVSVPMGGATLIVEKDGWVQPGMTPQTLVSSAMQAVMGGKKEDPGEGISISLSRPGEVVERTLEMARGGMLRGAVVAPGGTGVAGARVSVEFASTPGGFMRQIMAFMPIGEPRVTGEGGAFEIPAPAAGQKVVLVARAQGYLDGRSEPFDSKAEDVEGLSVSLRQGATLAGKVSEPGGKPLEGAFVRYTPMAEGGDGGRVWRLRSAKPHRTGEDGAFRIENVETGRLALQFSHPSFVSVSREGIEAADGKVAEVSAELAAAGAVSGRVLGADGKPFAGARIGANRVGPLPEGTDPYFRVPQDVATGTDGAFTVGSLPPGRYRLVARADGAADSDPAETETGAAPVTLRLAAAYSIAGIVRTRQGTPLSNVQVQAYRVQGEERSHEGSANTNREGRFEVRDVPQGTYEVRAEAGWGIGSSRPNLVPATVAGVAAGAQEVLIEVEEGLRIAGTVVKGDGTAVTEGWVNASRIAQPGEEKPPQVNANAAVLEGKFELTGLAPGRYRVGAGSNELPWKTVEAEAGAENVVIRYGLGGGIEGKVVRADGTAVARCWVQARGAEGDAGTQAGTDGKFLLRELPPGSYEVTVVHQDGGKVWEGSVSRVTVGTGSPTGGVEIVVRERE